jgi:hypothetical protein
VQTHLVDAQAPAAQDSVAEEQSELEIEERKQEEYPTSVAATGGDLPPGVNTKAARSSEPEITAHVRSTVTSETVPAEQQQRAAPSGARQPSLVGKFVSAASFVLVFASGRMPVSSFRVSGTLTASSHTARSARILNSHVILFASLQARFLQRLVGTGKREACLHVSGTQHCRAI